MDYSDFTSSNKICKLAKLLLSIDNIYEIAQKSEIKIRFENKEEKENQFGRRRKED